MLTIAPVMNELSSLKRKAIVLATSSACPFRCNGSELYVFVVPEDVEDCDPDSSLSNIGVSIGPLCIRQQNSHGRRVKILTVQQH